VTATIAQTAEKSRARRAVTTMAGALAAGFFAIAAASDAPEWPSPIYADRPVEYARDVLRVRDERTGELVAVEFLPEQAEILQALAEPGARVTVTTGHKCGKDFLASVAGCWFFCTFDGARVQLTAPTDRQVNGITWREVDSRVRQARVPVCEDGKLGGRAQTGLVAADKREIKGFTARTAEAVAGISGPHVLYIVTEASGVDDPIFEAIEGNLAGSDARLLLISNPTKKSGYFFDSHNDDKAKKKFKPFHLSSWTIAESLERSGRRIGGLATRKWCEERLEAWGKDDPRYKVRVLGEFVELEEDKVMSFELISSAQARWEETPVLDTDVLHVGVDPAWGGRDKTAVCLRRGRKVLAIFRWSEADFDRNAELVLQHVFGELRPREEGCVVKVDCGGEGWRLRDAMLAALHKWDPTGQRVRVHRIDFGWSTLRPESYLRLRDDLCFGARQWLYDGGAIPTDEQLEEDLLAPKYRQDVRGRSSVESKDELRKRLGRSTDSGDAFVLAVWSKGEVKGVEPPPPPPASVYESPAAVFDPYGAMDAWGRGGRGG
jgi:hypothetical protein